MVVCWAGRPFTPISCDAIYPYSTEGFQWNLPQIFIMWVGIADKVFKISSRRSWSYVYEYIYMCYNGRGIYFDDVA